MTRVVLDEGLQDLQTRMIELAHEIKNALSIILTALKTGEHLGLHEIIAHSSTIAGTCAATEQQALRLLILQQPLAGQDLRLLTAALFISDHFGRIGASIVQVAQTLLQASSLSHQKTGPSLYSVEGNAVDQQGHLTEVFILRGLLLLGEEIEYIFSTAMEAFAQRDAVKARTLEKCVLWTILRLIDIQLLHILPFADKIEISSKMTY